MKVAIASAAMIAASPAFADSGSFKYRTWTAPELLQRWEGLDHACRDGAVDEVVRKNACDERNLVAAALFNHGYCLVGGVKTLGNPEGKKRWKEELPARLLGERGEAVNCGGCASGRC